MRIIAGEARGRKLFAPAGEDTRPTADRIRESLFNIIGSRIRDANVLDLFGGSGSTLMACEQTDRICRTMELDPRYATAIVMRFANDYGTENIRLLRNGEELSYDAVVPQNDKRE